MAMDNEYQTNTASAQPRPVRRFLLIALFGLLLGVGLVIWGLSQSPVAREYLLRSDSSSENTEPAVVSVFTATAIGRASPNHNAAANANRGSYCGA